MKSVPEGFSAARRWFNGESRLSWQDAEGAAFFIGGNTMLKEMKAYGHLKPGQKGTQRLVARFGAALVCVRSGMMSEQGTT